MQTLRIHEMINNETLNLSLDSNSMEEAVRSLSDMLYKAGRLSSKEGFISDVLQRENLSSTNMGIGVAIPHGKTDNVTTASIAVGRLLSEVDWDAYEPVKVVILLAVPTAQKGTEHLEIIAKIASQLLEDSFISDLMNAQTNEALIKSIIQHIKED